MSSADHKAKVMMRIIFILLAIFSAVSLVIEGFGLTSLLLAACSLLALLLTITTPRQLQDFFDTLLD